VILATHADIFDALDPSTAAAVDEFWEVDFRSTVVADDLVDRARGLDLVGVVTAWEFFTPLVAEVASRLCLPANDPGKVLAARNKSAMASAFTRAGVRHARTRVVGRQTPAEEIVGSIDAYPVVVKPADNAGSCGVSVVHGPEGLQDAVDGARDWPEEFPHGIPLDTDILIQDYVGGREYSVETVGVDGEFRHVAITEKLTTTGSSRAELGHLVPARVDGAVREALLEEVTRALTAVGFRFGVAHTEVKVERGDAWIIETGVRPGGDLIPRLVQLSGGVDLIDASIAAATGQPVTLDAGGAGQASTVRFIVPPRAGVVRSLGNLPTDERVVEARFSKKVGDRVDSVSDNVSRLGHVILVGPDASTVDAEARRVLGAVRVVLT